MGLQETLTAGLGNRDRVYTLNVEVTGLCNAHCSYCHFYLKHDRQAVQYHISDQQFSDYCSFISYWAKNSGGTTNYRFSGGDPITLKDKLFERAREAFDATKIQPFLLTHGRRLKADWFEKARTSAFSAIYFSIENPVSPDPGAQDPRETVRLISEFNSDEMPLKLGVCVVPNNQFTNLMQICDWFYDRLGYIPAIAEVNYGAYTSPTTDEWSALERELDKVVTKYHGKTHLNLFHSVSPELSYSGADPYVFSLGLINRFGINQSNISDKAIEIAKDLRESNYPGLSCSEDCSWSDFCQNTKWYWQGDSENSRKIKLKDYCKFKRLLNDTYYRNIVDPKHKPTTASIAL